MTISSMEDNKYYLDIGGTADLNDKKERLLYRFFEIIPGVLSLATLLLTVIGARFFPVHIAIFIIVFDVYWLLKTLFLSLHLRSGFKKMQEHMKIDWLAKLKQSANKISKSSAGADASADRQSANCNDLRFAIGDWRNIYHLIILPFVNEPYEVLEASVKALLDSNYPKDKFIVVLASEQRTESRTRETSRKIAEKYSGSFFKFLITVHPDNIEGELIGKGSNETWAAKEAKRLIIDPLIKTQNIRGNPHLNSRESAFSYENIIVSVFDSDTRVYPDYFACLTYHYLAAENPLRSSFQPIPVFNNNIWEAPAFSRVVGTSCTFWQIMQQARPERLATFSSQSIGFKQLAEMDFWNVKNVSEDSRIFWKALLYYDGDYKTAPLYYPVSMDANLAPTVWQTILNVYRQQRRWGWGAENIPYFLFGCLKNKKMPVWKKLKYSFNQFEGFWSWATNALMIFLLGWLPVLIGGPEFQRTALSYNLPQITRILMTLASVGLISSAIYSAILLPPKPIRHPRFKYLFMILQWALLPFTIIIFGSIPGLDSQIRLMLGGKLRLGFWVTPKYRVDPARVDPALASRGSTKNNKL